jgi:hypothetical protein
MHHSYVGDWNKFPSCKCELFVSCGDDEHQTSLEWDRSSNPVTPPGRVSYTLSLKWREMFENKLLNIRLFVEIQMWRVETEG